MSDIERDPSKFVGTERDLSDTEMYGSDVVDGSSLPGRPPLPGHGIDYPEAYLQEPVRELLRKSQSDQEPDASRGLRYAAAAYDLGQQATDDPTAAGEAAAKAGFRAAQTERPTEQIEAWFTRSEGALDARDPLQARELIATHLLRGRALGFRAIRAAQTRKDLVGKARTSFEKGEAIIRAQHRRGETWDPYATMLSRHRATHEAANGNKNLAAKVALRGVWRAVRARQENANASDAPLTTKSVVKHAKFVGKQASMNAVALGLAVAQPRKQGTSWAKTHRQIARKMLG